MNSEKLSQLSIDPAKKRRSRTLVNVIVGTVILVTVIAILLARPWSEEGQRVFKGQKASKEQPSGGPAAAGASRAAATPTQASSVAPASGAGVNGPVLTASGYIINRERIELSPRFMGVVKWIGVRKGDSVTNGQVVVLLDDAEYKVRLLQNEARMATAKVALEKAKLAYERVNNLGAANIESKQAQDDARLALRSAEATLKEIEAQMAGDRLYLEWSVIRSPVDGVVLEKLVDANELVTPQTFGGSRGPSASLLALADANDLQIEVDLNESDLAKVFLQQPCKVSPEAYPDRAYEGRVAEIAPEANRQKGTLQIKVQVLNPDKFLIPELTARVDFLGMKAAEAK
jgi:HlyD family secretion protein